MYRRCPNCRKEIYIELLQNKLENDINPDNLISAGEFAMKCPYCQKGFIFLIKLMTENEYQVSEAEKREEYRETIESIHETIGVSFE